ncbi:MAG: hypothetical protein ABEK59_04385 [Halobacteria archaeon]
MSTNTRKSEVPFNDKQTRILGHIEGQVETGKQYFKSKYMADELGMSSREIGANMLRLAEESERFHIEKWNQTSATTWKVEKRKP